MRKKSHHGCHSVQSAFCNFPHMPTYMPIGSTGFYGPQSCTFLLASTPHLSNSFLHMMTFAILSWQLVHLCSAVLTPPGLLQDVRAGPAAATAHLTARLGRPLATAAAESTVIIQSLLVLFERKACATIRTNRSLTFYRDMATYQCMKKISTFLCLGWKGKNPPLFYSEKIGEH